MTETQKILFSMQDKKYKDFSSALMPTVPTDTVIGVRTPVLRKFAKDFAKTPEADSFINKLPHKYFEENNLHAFIIEEIKDFNVALIRTEEFLPYIDNWATCDSFMPKIFKQNRVKLINIIKNMLTSSHAYTIRYAIGLLMKLYLDDEFKSEYPLLVAEVKSDEYYVNMMRAWYFATALTKQYDNAIKYLEKGVLDLWTHNKIIQKACESYRITNEKKIYLKTLKRK